MRTYKFGGNTALIKDDWKLSKARDTRATFECTVLDYEPSVYEEVVFNNEGDYFLTADGEPFITADGAAFTLAGVAIFKGIVKSTAPVRDGSSVFYDVEAVDFSVIADNRITSFVLYGKTAAEIISLKLAPILAEEGVSLGTIDTGATISKCVFPFKTLAYIADSLASVSGDYYWTIDSNKVFHFKERTTRLTDIVIDADTPIKNLKYVTDSGDYRNIQVVVGAATPTAPQTETVEPVDNIYTVRFPIQSQPSITVGGVAQTSIGVSGLDSGTDWTWSYQSKEITYNGETPPAEIVVLYTGLYPVIARTKNQTEINLKKALTGGSGIKETLYTDDNINSGTQARQFATALLERHSKDGETVSYDTESINYSVGDIISVVREEMGINGLFEVLKIEAREADADSIEYSVTLTNGSTTTWDRYFARLTDKANTVTIGDDNIATTLKEDEESWTVGGSYVIGHLTETYPSDTSYPSDTEYPGIVTEVATVND